MDINKRDTAATAKRYWVRLTRTCNNGCIFCLDKEAQDGTFLSMPRITSDLRKGRHSNIKRVVLSGGEPTMHPRFLEVVATAKRIGYEHIQVITNGRLFAYSGLLEQALDEGVREITFSIHGHTRKLHDKQTKVSGSFKQSLTGLINALKTKRVITNVDIVVNKINVMHLEDIIKFYINIGVYEFDLLQVVPFGRAWENRKKILYDIAKALPYLEKAFNLSKNPSLYIWTNRFPPAYLEGFEELIQHPYKLFDEVNGRRKTFFDYLIKSIDLFCYGQRCRFCFLEDFCKDLISLKKRGVLYAKKIPPCINGLPNKRQGSKLLYSDVVGRKKVALEKLCKFYINNRYFVKGKSCQECKLSSFCSGAPIGFVRHKGFPKLI